MIEGENILPHKPQPTRWSICSQVTEIAWDCFLRFLFLLEIEEEWEYKEINLVMIIIITQYLLTVN